MGEPGGLDALAAFVRDRLPERHPLFEAMVQATMLRIEARGLLRQRRMQEAKQAFDAGLYALEEVEALLERVVAPKLPVGCRVQWGADPKVGTVVATAGDRVWVRWDDDCPEVPHHGVYEQAHVGPVWP